MDFKIAVVIVYALLLSACGGGSSGGDPNSSVATAGQTFIGSASFGPIHNALVEIYTVDEQGQRSQLPITATYTDSEGTFEVNADDLPPIVYVEISGRSDEVSLMRCVLSHCGLAGEGSIDSDDSGSITLNEWAVIGPSLVLKSYIADWDASRPIAINLLTHIAAETLSPPVNSTSIESLYRGLQQTLAINVSPAYLVPVDPTGADSDIDQLIAQLLMGALLQQHLPNVDQTLEEGFKDLIIAIRQSPMPYGSVSLTEVALDAIDMTDQLSHDDLEAVKAMLQGIANTHASREGKLRFEERPLRPPFS